MMKGERHFARGFDWRRWLVGAQFGVHGQITIYFGPWVFFYWRAEPKPDLRDTRSQARIRPVRSIMEDW